MGIIRSLGVEIVGDGLRVLEADRQDGVLPPIRNHGGFFVSWIQKYARRREAEERGE